MPLPVHPFLVVASLTLAALTPAKVSDVTTNASAMPVSKPPKTIYVDTFSISQDAPKSEDSDSGGGGRPRLFGMFRGGQDNTLIGRHKEEQHEELLEKLPARCKRP